MVAYCDRLTCGRLVAQGECEGVDGGAELVGDAQLVGGAGVLLGDGADGQLGGVLAVVRALLQHLRPVALGQGLRALAHAALVVEAPEDLGGAGVRAEADQDVLGLPHLEVVEGDGLVRGHGLELDVEVEAGEVLVCLLVGGGEAGVVHDAGDGLAVVAGLGLVVEHLHLPRPPVLELHGGPVLHPAQVRVLAQHPAEGGGRPRPVSYTRDLEISRVRYLELDIYLESVIYEICNRTDDDSRRMT